MYQPSLNISSTYARDTDTHNACDGRMYGQIEASHASISEPIEDCGRPTGNIQDSEVQLNDGEHSIDTMSGSPSREVRIADDASRDRATSSSPDRMKSPSTSQDPHLEESPRFVEGLTSRPNTGVRGTTSAPVYTHQDSTHCSEARVCSESTTTHEVFAAVLNQSAHQDVRIPLCSLWQSQDICHMTMEVFAELNSACLHFDTEGSSTIKVGAHSCCIRCGSGCVKPKHQFTAGVELQKACGDCHTALSNSCLCNLPRPKSEDSCHASISSWVPEQAPDHRIVAVWANKACLNAEQGAQNSATKRRASGNSQGAHFGNNEAGHFISTATPCCAQVYLDSELDAIRSVTPPVTKDSLKELELSAIQNNLTLRIDLCFDHELFFQKISGPKGEEKSRKATIYYECLRAELQAYSHALHVPHEDVNINATHAYLTVPSRLGPFFQALRDLLEMLVPEDDKGSVVERIDVSWLVMQVRLGKFNAVSFSSWLADLLMMHCAPMRDEEARNMCKQISEGSEDNDFGKIVDGLRDLLNLLENMKLDIANHQVRSFKLLLIADTVPFLKDCFSKMIESRQLTLRDSKYWFRNVKRLHDQKSQMGPVIDCFVNGVIEMCKSQHASWPQTFSYDQERLQTLQEDILARAQLRICLRTYCELAKLRHSPCTTEIQKVSDRIVQLIHSEEGARQSIPESVESISVEIARAAAVTPTSESDPSNTVSIDFDLAASRLQHRLANEQWSVVDEVVQQMGMRTQDHVARFQKLGTLQISNEQRNWSLKRSSKGIALAPDIEDMARRLAHIIVIHWEVWSDLVYLDDA